MQALARPVRSDQVIVAHPGQDAAANISRMHDDIHVAFDAHRLVLADQRPLDEIVALAVTVQPLFFRTTVLVHKHVIFFENIFAARARLEQRQVEFARFKRESEVTDLGLYLP